MNPSPQKQNTWLTMGSSMLLLCTCMMLVVGVAWGRYRTQLSENIQYYPKQLSQIYLWGSPNEAGSYDSLPTTWALLPEESSMRFTVTNGIPGAEGQEDLYAGEDLEFYIRVMATEGIREGENVSIRLELPDPLDEAAAISYTGVPVKIEEKSPLYDSFGGGWVYYFYETDGTEARWILEGGQLSAFTATLVSAATKGEMDPSMLQLQAAATEKGEITP